MHYSITYQNVLPPYLIYHQDIVATSIEEAKKKFREMHPFNEYADETIIRIDLIIK